MANEIRGIIFDLGGVLSDTAPRKAVLHECERSLGLSQGQIDDLLFNSEAWHRVSSGKMSARDYWEWFVARLGQTPPAALAPFRYNPFAYEALRPEMLTLVAQLGERYRIALCSNATFHLNILLAENRMWHLFDTVVISAYVAMRKPDPEILLLTARRLALAPQQCLFIDDKERNTAVAADLGMRTIPFHSSTTLNGQLAEHGISMNIAPHSAC